MSDLPEVAPMTAERVRAILAKSAGEPMAREDTPIITTHDVAELCRGWLTANGDPADIEVLAAAEHESWSGWTKWMLGRIESELKSLPEEESKVGAFSAFDGLHCVQRWIRQMETPYADLPEKEKESDRIEAREKLKVYRCS